MRKVNKKIGVLLPFKDHFTNSKAGSASIWIKDFNKKSTYKNNIYVCGNTDNTSESNSIENFVLKKINVN